MVCFCVSFQEWSYFSRKFPFIVPWPAKISRNENVIPMSDLIKNYPWTLESELIGRVDTQAECCSARKKERASAVQWVVYSICHHPVPPREIQGAERLFPTLPLLTQSLAHMTWKHLGGKAVAMTDWVNLFHLIQIILSFVSCVFKGINVIGLPTLKNCYAILRIKCCHHLLEEMQILNV